MSGNIIRADARAIETVVSVLKNGGIVAFPTDTVYGIGCDAFSEDAIIRIYAMKKRNRNKPLVMFLARKEHVSAFARKPGKSVSRICDRFFPGALTVIMRATSKTPSGLVAKEGSVSIRIPDYQFLRQVVKHLDRPLATTSANVAGGKPPRTHRDIDLEPDLMVKDDTVPSGTASAILDTSVFPFVMRRKGTISLYAIERLIPSKVRLDTAIGFNVLFVCTGNSCRSPMAEGMLAAMVRRQELQGISVSSCGISAVSGFPATHHALEVMRIHGYDIVDHRSRSVADCDLLNMDLILCMERHHQREIQRRHGAAADRTFLLTEYCGRKGDIRDPIGCEKGVYEAVAHEIEICVRKVAREIALRYQNRRDR